MDQHALELLEFCKIQQAIAAGAVLEATREAVARIIIPTSDRASIIARRDAISEIVRLLQAGHDFAIEDTKDPREALKRAHIEDSSLAGTELVQVAALLRSAANLKRFFKSHQAEAPLAAHMAGQLVALPEIQAHLAKAVGEDGVVLDDASPELRRLRGEIRVTYSRIEKKLEAILHNPDLQDTFSGDRPTQRSGRLVLPMKSNRWTAVGGLVHDRSHTAQTFFVEPAVTIELGNDLQNLAAEEEAEVRRILLDLTRQLRPHLDDLERSFETLVQLDLLRAAARLAERRNMAPAEVAEQGAAMEIVEARHPVLQATLEMEGHGAALVPLSIKLAPETRVLAVTGSNTGGKTVALKTIGLVVLMAQAGLHVPARRAALPLFDQVLVDIGDEQSIEQSLSTFSGHMSQIISVLQRAGDKSLVLLDELGGGTDPAEGGALACSIIEHLASRGATAAVTTHLREVKIFCQDRPDTQNAAMEFDLQTLRPTFRLVQGEPGQSHALAIAQRLGLPEPVINRAKTFLSDEHLNLESLLARLSEERRLLREELDQARREREAAAAKRAKLEIELAESKKERKVLLRQAYREASGIVDNTRRQMQDVVRAARKKGEAGPQVEALRQTVQQKKEALSKGSQQFVERARPKANPDTLREGQTVFVETFRANGVVQAVNRRKKRVTVSVGGLVVEVAAGDLSLPDERAAEEQTRAPVTVTPASSEAAALELNIIGQRAAPALVELERFLEHATMAGYVQINVIHGRGTGALMRAVHEHLRGHVLVESFRSGNEVEGGVAVTVVKLKE